LPAHVSRTVIQAEIDKDNRLAATVELEFTAGPDPVRVLPLHLDGVLRLTSAEARVFYNTVAVHEIAHQWWGHLVGWRTYHDQWLSESFAEFSVVLYLEQIEPKKVDMFWNLKRRWLLSATAGGKTLLHFSLQQSEVPSTFFMKVPFYAEMGGQLRRLGMLSVEGTQTIQDDIPLPFKPDRIVLDPYNQILCTIKQ
jgi:hypothetical protein